jgi:hypothetical protein
MVIRVQARRVVPLASSPRRSTEPSSDSTRPILSAEKWQKKMRRSDLLAFNAAS